jgi:hypothetical protein
MTISVGQGTGAPSVMPGTDGLPSIAGLPMIITLVETDAPGAGITVAVVHGLLAGDGGTGHVQGLADTSPAHSAGDPPTITLVCFGNRTTGPAWQQVIWADVLAIGGMPFLCAMAPRSIARALPSDNHPRG